MLKKIKEVVKKTVKYVKKGVKWIMEKKNELIDNSLAVRVYENTREDVKELGKNVAETLSDSDKRVDLGLMIVGLGVSLIVSGLFKKRNDKNENTDTNEEVLCDE